MRRLIVGSLATTLMACAVLLGAPEASARVDVCARACTVRFKRGGSNCQKKVKAGIRKRQKSCQTDFRSTGFSSVQKCRTEAAKFGHVLLDQCKVDRYMKCLDCCKLPGGTKDTCAPKPSSPSAAFIELGGPLM